MILNDKQIKKLVKDHDMITPFISESISQGISHGLNSFGFDLGVEMSLKFLQT